MNLVKLRNSYEILLFLANLLTNDDINIPKEVVGFARKNHQKGVADRV